MNAESSDTELSVLYARVSGLLLTQETVDRALETVTSLARETLLPTAGAGVTIMDSSDQPSTIASTGSTVASADAAQYELDDGPCLTACREARVVRVDDIENEPAWPQWTQRVTPLQLRSSLSAPLVIEGRVLGALKVYADQTDAYDDRAERLLGKYADQTAILVHNVRSSQDAELLSDELRSALLDRDVMALAQGILMSDKGVGREEAFAMLVAQSRADGVRAIDVARQITCRGTYTTDG